MDKVTGQCPQTTTFLKRKESRSGIEPRSFRLPTLPLGQTGSLMKKKKKRNKTKNKKKYIIIECADAGCVYVAGQCLCY